jgi:hypothetical protein
MIQKKNARITRDNILKDDVILIFSFCGNYGVIDVNNCGDLFL